MDAWVRASFRMLTKAEHLEPGRVVKGIMLHILHYQIEFFFF